METSYFVYYVTTFLFCAVPLAIAFVVLYFVVRQAVQQGIIRAHEKLDAEKTTDTE